MATDNNIPDQPIINRYGLIKLLSHAGTQTILVVLLVVAFYAIYQKDQESIAAKSEHLCDIKQFTTMTIQAIENNTAAMNDLREAIRKP